MAIWKEHWILPTGLLAGVAAVIAFAYWWHQKPVDRGPSMTPPPSAMHHLGISGNKTGDNKNESSVAANLEEKSAPVTAQPTSIRQRMKTATDWYIFAKEILPKAKAGDPEAQYVLFKMYRHCFDSSGIERKKYNDVNDVREFATKYGLNVDDAVSRFQQCHGFNTDDAASLGDPWDWLQKATDAGYAPAQALMAYEKLSQDDAKATLRAGGSPTDPLAHMPPIGGDANPRELLAVAAQSADPEVLAQIGNLQYRLHPTQPPDVTKIDGAAWIYVACQRQGECSGQPTTVVNCGPNDANCVAVPNWLLSQVNYNWAPVQEKVNQINAALNAKQWEQLNQLLLGPGG